MKIVFPHFGYSYVAFKAAAETIGLDYVIPPMAGKKDMELGSRLSPETICLPFKLNVGNLIYALEAGADTITMAGGVGPCRFGYYAKGLETILKDMGYKFKMLSLNQRDLPEIYRTLRDTKSRKFSFINFVRGFILMWQKAKALAELEALKRKWMPYAIRRGDVKFEFERGLKRIDDAKGIFETLRARRDNKRAFKKILKDRSIWPLKIGIIGEIYMILEPYANLNLEEKLGKMGVETHTILSLHKWMKHIFRVDLFGKRSFRNLRRIARPYLSENAGGEAQNNIGSAILYAREGYDGVIHIYPFTCMPGLIGHTILNKVSRDHDIPIFNFSIDEQTGEAGLKTRLEAFVELLKKRREEKLELLSGN